MLPHERRFERPPHERWVERPPHEEILDRLNVLEEILRKIESKIENN